VCKLNKNLVLVHGKSFTTLLKFPLFKTLQRSNEVRTRHNVPKFPQCTRFTMSKHVLPIALIFMILKLTSTITCENCAELILRL
jgi:hypothetical protein